MGSASASEVSARPPGSGYNFRPRSRSATAPKNRRLGSVELQGVGSTLDLPAVTPPNSPTPSGAGNPTHNADTHISTIVTHNSATTSNLPFSTLVPDTGAWWSGKIFEIPHTYPTVDLYHSAVFDKSAKNATFSHLSQSKKLTGKYRI